MRCSVYVCHTPYIGCVVDRMVKLPSHFFFFMLRCFFFIHKNVRYVLQHLSTFHLCGQMNPLGKMKSIDRLHANGNKKNHIIVVVAVGVLFK